MDTSDFVVSVFPQLDKKITLSFLWILGIRKFFGHLDSWK